MDTTTAAPRRLIPARRASQTWSVRPILARPMTEKVFVLVARAILCSALLILVALVGDIVLDGWDKLTGDFMMSFPSRKAANAGVLAAWTGSLWLLLLTVVFALPLGIGAALYLEEYARRSRFTTIVELCIANLAGVPSVIYGILGLQVFVRSLGFGRSLLAGALTLALLVLPILIMTSREAIRAVPKSYREAALALGATRWQITWTQVIPSRAPRNSDRVHPPLFSRDRRDGAAHYPRSAHLPGAGSELNFLSIYRVAHSGL